MHMNNFIMCFLLSWSCGETGFFLFAENPYPLNITDFPSEFSTPTEEFLSLNGQHVQVRGFWYPISDNEGILDSQADMKSCCLAKPTKIHQQLIVKGQVFSHLRHRVINLEGIFKIDPQYNQNGQLRQLYVLEQAKEVQTNSHFILLGSLTILILGIYCAFKRFIIGC